MMKLKGRLKQEVLNFTKQKLKEFEINGRIEIDDCNIDLAANQTIRVLKDIGAKPTLKNLKLGTFHHSLLILGHIRMMYVTDRDDPKQGPAIIDKANFRISVWKLYSELNKE